MLDENVGSLIGRVTYNMRFGKVVDNKEVISRSAGKLGRAV